MRVPRVETKDLAEAKKTHAASHNFERFLAELDAQTDRYIPPLWTPEYVGVRLIEASDALHRWRTPIGPRKAQSLRLDVWHGDLTPRDLADIARFREAETFPDRPDPPDKYELDRAERVILWPSRFLSHDADMAACTTRWAYWRARDFDIEAYADRFYVGQREGFDVKRKQGLERIAQGLNREKVFTD